MTGGTPTGGAAMATHEEILDEVYELALHNEMTYFG